MHVKTVNTATVAWWSAGAALTALRTAHEKIYPWCTKFVCAVMNIVWKWPKSNDHINSPLSPPSHLICTGKCWLSSRAAFLHCPAQHSHSYTALLQFHWSRIVWYAVIQGKKVLHIHFDRQDRQGRIVDCSEQLMCCTINCVNLNLKVYERGQMAEHRFLNVWTRCNPV